ncbi:aminoacyl-histidine dipeptidase [Paracrocinitomix mangrovi]|uniref:aminoacyl-histidine dipeptidase n=1 Tax=Paracrocinitomix mangrovi TaxID=2862509 RepID=UPI001C8ECDF7|nr:aminoacyl-histidine dipeptidase [Paracrocinitomix mangrovi]UKN02430.1 aminoacyl-histidine dipeptidase [Paracrocinitomix mangrovi]
MNVRDLEPKIVWNHFEDLNAVPRPSKKEERIRKFMMDFGNGLGLETLEDAIGNVIIKKPASAGMENRKTVILQAHIDMVHQKNADTDFDFSAQGIQSYIDGEWVKAKGTTLGADNGMGVAAAMAVLSNDEIKHPAIEALFTIDEETGMTGAKELDGSKLSGSILLNLDTEDDDEFSIGCAGGIDTNTEYEYQEEDITADYTTFKIELKGLKGGHSGMDIHLGRGNANLLMNRIIYEMMQDADVRICELDGGSLRNAIPRESFGVVAIKSNKQQYAIDTFKGVLSQIKDEYREVEPDMVANLTSCDYTGKMVSKHDMDAIVAAIYTTPNAVWKMSFNIPGLVETSSSLAKVIIKDGAFKTQSLQRSMIESGKRDIANAIKLNYEQIGAEVVQGGDYPGWAPNPDSEILEVMKGLYASMFKDEPKVEACHAGLECGILREHLPACDMISFGPTIRNPHSPDEKVNIASVQKFWNLFLKVLEDIPAN